MLLRRLSARAHSIMIMNLVKVAALLLVAFASTFGQEIPNGVRYKKAPDAINSASKARLEAALASDLFPTDFFYNSTVVGPILWKSLRGSADEVLLGTRPVVMVVPGPPSFVTEGRGIRTDNERRAFWKLLRSKYPALKNGKVRKGNAQEISYYWATIPFDIEEPFWVIDAGADRFIAHFHLADGQARLFWIDRVGDLQTLKP